MLWALIGGKTQFYLYFPEEAQAQPVISALRRDGFKIISRPAADGESWLILAKKRIKPPQLDEIEEVLLSLAAAHGGEYDGYDRAI